jgi:hypothetical protein
MMVTLNFNMKGHMEVFQKILGKGHKTFYAFPFYEYVKHIRDPSKVTLLSVRCLVLYLSLKI